MTTNKPEVKRFNILTYQGAIQSKGAMCVMASDYDALQAECEKLRKDAARYRWLRDSCIDNSESAYIGVWHEESGRYVDTFIDREAIDAAIDAAIQEDKP